MGKREFGGVFDKIGKLGVTRCNIMRYAYNRFSLIVKRRTAESKEALFVVQTRLLLVVNNAISECKNLCFWVGTRHNEHKNSEFMPRKRL